jgi:hypothetical protein
VLAWNLHPCVIKEQLGMATNKAGACIERSANAWNIFITEHVYSNIGKEENAPSGHFGSILVSINAFIQ